ncbi:restriction endonuclease subunit S [Desulfobacter sp.]|uniref:restriction endonuclease subunit S n=1 Tax=Desulfobacter sp. TaxID=2294 RepID=UPI003D0E12B6
MTDLLPVMPRYEAYKDSEVEWIGEIPVHWEVRPIKQFSRIYSGDAIINSALNEDSEYEVFGGNGFMGYTNNFNVEGTNIVIGRVGAYCGNIRLIHDRKWISDNALILSLKIENAYSFFAYLLWAVDLNKLNESNAQPLITATKILNVRIACPPFDEQITIANFLDRKTAKIDQAVAIKEKQIRLLKEHKQILIQNAMTKGLDPNVPMADSGVEWIGQIPAHWDVFSVKRIFRLVAEPSEKNNHHELLSIYTDIGVMPRKELKEKGNKASTTDGYWLVQKGDFIVNKLLAWMGAIGLSDYKGVTSPAYDILRPIRQIDGYFYHFLFRTKEFSVEMKKHSKGIMDMRLRLYFDKFGMLQVPFPPQKEQKSIVSHIQTQSAKIDQAITLQEQMIEKLKEYKATLINAAVTGKIRVPDGRE